MTPYQDYPRMLYHRTHPAVIVLNASEEAALGAGWDRTWNPDVHQPPAPDCRMPVVGADGTRFPPLPAPAEPPPLLGAEAPQAAARKRK